ncbi:MAG: glycosyltransferase family 4 protein [bacterium]|nr:glycosyltransferase family 4 protein [bacterium]
MALSEWLHRRKKTVQGTADLFLATSQFVKSKFVEAGFPGDQIEVHPNFIDFDPLESVRQPGPYAIFVGRLSEEKGLLTLLKAFKELPDLPLKILGDGPLEKRLKEFTGEHKMKNVEFAGFIDGKLKKDLLTGARFLIFSSECYESFGYSIIESFACGVPVIASDIGGARELVTEGQTGFLFEPGNPADLRKSISRMSALEHDALMAIKENALKWAKKLYTGEKGYQNLVELFDKINS